MKLAWFYMYVNYLVFGHPFGFGSRPTVRLRHRVLRRGPYINEPYGSLRRVLALDIRKHRVENLSFDTVTTEKEVVEAISKAISFAKTVKGILVIAEAHEDAQLRNVVFQTSIRSLLESSDRLPGSIAAITALAKERVIRIDFEFMEQLEEREPRRELLFLTRSREGLLHYVYAINPKVIRWSGGSWIPL